MNEKIITLNGTEYIVKTDNGQSLTPELLTNIKNQLMVKMAITSNLNIVKLGTPTCPSSVPLNTVGTLTASVTQGTAPFTYTWTITKPDNTTATLPNSPGPHSYTFASTGIYGINLTVVDNCPSGGLSDTSFCSVTVAPSTGSISFSSSPSGANIYLDGTLQTSMTPTTISNVSPGSHSYTITLSGYNNATGSVGVIAGQTATVSVTLTPFVTTGSIAFTSSPSGANIYLDGTLVGITPATISNVSAGSHSYTLTLSSYNDYTGTVTVTAGQTSTVSATLTALPTTGSIAFTSTPSAANIYIDNILQTPKTPATITNVPAGSHTYIIRLSGYNDATGSVTVTAGQTTNVSVTLTPSTGSIYFTSTPSGADIYLDGTNVGMTPATITSVTPGTHSYTLTLSGYNNATGSVTVTTGQTTNVSVTLTSIITTGSIAFSSTPSGASIYLDGTLVGTTPTTINGVSLNIAHSYILTLSGYNNYTGSITLTTASPNQTVTATLTPTPSYTNWVTSKGGASGLYHNLSALGEIIDGYLGMINLGFTVTLGNVGTTINYYLGV